MEIRRRGLEHELPTRVQDFIDAFDGGDPVEPFSFELDYPAEVAA
jgi:hypothetical protein